MEKNKKKQRGMFGQLLRDIREFQNVSKKELSRGICSKKALEKYESGEREPDVLTAAALFSRLKKSLEKFNTISDHTEYEQTKRRIKIWRWLCSGNLAQAEKEIEEYAKINDALHYQYVCFFRAELLRKRQAPIGEQIANVVDGIYQTLETEGNPRIRKTTEEEKTGNALKPDMLSRGRYSKMELLLLERYAILLEENGEGERAVLWYKAIVGYLEDEEYDWADQYILYPIMAYKLAGYYEAQRLYGTAMEWIRRGCKMLRKSKKQLALFCRLMELKFQIEDWEEAGRKPNPKEREAYQKMLESLEFAKGKGTGQGGGEALLQNETLGDWRENWYPMYEEKYRICFGDMIRERRKAKGLSKLAPAYGICDERTIERMEARKNTPQADTREKLLKKLGLPLEKYNAGIVTEQYEDYRKSGQMAELCQQGKYREAKVLYEELKKGLDMENVTNIQWAEYWDIRITDGLRPIPQKFKEDRLWAVLRKTVPMKDGCPQFECRLMDNEKNIWIAIAERADPKDTKVKCFLLRQIRTYYREREKELIEPQYLVQLFILLGNFTIQEGKYALALRYLHMAEKRWWNWMNGIYGNIFYIISNWQYKKWTQRKKIFNVSNKHMQSVVCMQKIQ